MKHKYSVLSYLFAFLMCIAASDVVAMQRQIYFKETTFKQFAYPNGIADDEYTAIIRKRSAKQFPKAKTHIIKSYISNDKPRTIIEYYTQLSGQRFFKEGDRFIFVFSQITDQPATRIEIYPVPIARIHREFWPTRIDLYVIRYPIVGDMPEQLNRKPDELKKRVGRFFYDGELREDIARLDMEQSGPGSEIYVIATRDDFEKIYRFFRRKLKSFPVRPARDGDMLTRDFEVDISRAGGVDSAGKDVYVAVEENPVVMDGTGNSQLYRGWVFIRYTFWDKESTRVH